jgi:hypothetical protein
LSKKHVHALKTAEVALAVETAEVDTAAVIAEAVTVEAVTAVAVIAGKRLNTN